MRRSTHPFSILGLVIGAALAAVHLSAAAPEAPPPPQAAAEEEPSDEGSEAQAPGQTPGQTGLWRRIWPAPEEGTPGATAPGEGDQATGRLRDRRQGQREARVLTPTRHLTDIQRRLRGSAVGRDAAGAHYLDLIDREQASAADLNAFAIYLAERGLLDDALEYARVALRADRENPDLWNNLGTIHQHLGDTGSAMTAFEKAVAIDANHGLAHYNLGTVHDAQGHYDEAIEQYRIALTLDPRLGDTNYNPQVVNNDRMLAVKLLLYQREAGALGLPLVQLPGSSPAPQPAPVEATPPRSGTN